MITDLTLRYMHACMCIHTQTHRARWCYNQFRNSQCFSCLQTTVVTEHCGTRTGTLRRIREDHCPQAGSLVDEPDGFVHKLNGKKSFSERSTVSPSCLGKMAPNLRGFLPSTPWLSVALGLPQNLPIKKMQSKGLEMLAWGLSEPASLE